MVIVWSECSVTYGAGWAHIYPVIAAGLLHFYDVSLAQSLLGGNRRYDCRSCLSVGIYGSEMTAV